MCVCARVCVCLYSLVSCSFRFSVSSFLASFLVEGFLVINPEEKSDLHLLLLFLFLLRLSSVPRCSAVLLHLRSSVSSRIKIQAITTRLERVLVGRAGHTIERNRRGDARKEETQRVPRSDGDGETRSSLPRIGGSTIQDYSLSLRGGCARAPRPSDALEEYKTRGSWVPLYSLVLSFVPFTLLRLASSFAALRSAAPFLFPFHHPPPLPLPLSPIHGIPTSLARSIFSPSPLPLPTSSSFFSMPLDTCSSRWIRILLGIQVYVYAGKSIKEGSTHSKRSARDRPYGGSIAELRSRRGDRVIK